MSWVGVLLMVYPMACGVIAQLFAANRAAGYLGSAIAYLPMMGFMGMILIQSGARRIPPSEIMIAIVMVAIWGLLYWTGRKLGKPFSEMLAAHREAQRSKKIRENF
ncbi:hypothetical protein [Hyphomonas sp.]|uniref:hypothetical protein n=1 Tax=Hyphomonas sp. TaxID=87 RepID=UPI00391D7121